MITLIFHGGLHVIEKRERHCVKHEVVSNTTLEEVLAAIEYPSTAIGLAVVNDKLIKLSDTLMGDEIINLYPMVDGG